jgi:hypothetical protein
MAMGTQPCPNAALACLLHLLCQVALLEGLVGGTEEASAKLAALGEGGAGAAAVQQANGAAAVAAAEAKMRSLQKQLDDARAQMDMLRQAAKGHVQVHGWGQGWG